MDSIVDDQQGFVLCDKGFDWSAGRWLHSGNGSFCDVFLQNPGIVLSTGVLLVVVECARLSYQKVSSLC